MIRRRHWDAGKLVICGLLSRGETRDRSLAGPRDARVAQEIHLIEPSAGSNFYVKAPLVTTALTYYAQGGNVHY